MNANERTIHDFYSAFQKRDAAAMAACYHPDVRFSDPVFPDLRGSRPGDMWRIPGGVVHGLVCGDRPIRAIDVFYPIREDYTSKP